MRILIFISFLVCNSIVALNNHAVAFQQPPNIIVIMADDMGYGDVSALNPQSKIQTPVLDQLIKDGRNFTEAHTSASLCTPARYAFLTGRYNFRTGLSGVASGYSKPMIEYDRETLASVLKKAGYSTAIIGKWHLGLEWKPKNPNMPIYTTDSYTPENLNVDYRKPVKGVNEIGFDYSYISPAGNNLAPFCFIENGRVTELPTDYFEPQITGKYAEDYENRRNGGDKAPGYLLSSTLETITNKAVDYLKDTPKDGKPFFLYLPFTAPHFPWMAQQQFRGTSKAGAYGDFMQEIDARVGVILDALKKQNLDKNTLVIFTADNGGATPENFLSKYGHEMNKGRRGQKSEIWEGGVRVPFIARWPAVISAGSISYQAISFVDMLATFAKISGVTMDSKYAEDSEDVSYAFSKNIDAKQSRKAMINQSGSASGLAILEQNWKLIPYGYGKHGSDSATETQPKGQLYNLLADPMETKNLYNENPKLVKRLTQLLETYKIQGFSRSGVVTY